MPPPFFPAQRFVRLIKKICKRSCHSSRFTEFPKYHLNVSLNSPSGAGDIATPRDAKQG